MSAASVASQPLTTTYIQAPTRFNSMAENAERIRLGISKGPAPASYYRTGSNFGVTQFEGVATRIIDTLPNPIQLNLPNPYTEQMDTLLGRKTQTPQTSQQQQQYSQSPLSSSNSSSKKSPPKSKTRINPNSRTSAGFPLAVTPQQAAETAARKAAEKEQWEEEQNYAFEVAKAQAIREQAMKADEKARINAEIYTPGIAAKKTSTPQSHLNLSKAEQAAVHKKQKNDSKISFRDRIVPPKPDYAEDPFTAQASEHTGIYPGPIQREIIANHSNFPLPKDTEPLAPEGSIEREEQKRRVNPLLDPQFLGKHDAAGLGFGRTHRNHYKYISHWTSPELHKLSYELSTESDALSGYRSKSGLGRRDEVRGLGWGHEHGSYNEYVSVRRVDDILKDYGGDREACLKFYNRSK